MPRTQTCPKCQASMVEGFVIDATHYERRVSSWLEGGAANVKLKGKTPIEIATWRCPGCGFLESHAVTPPA